MTDYRSNVIKANDVNNAPLKEAIKGLPTKLKDPKRYEKIEKELADIMFSDHKHRKVSAFVKCKRCQAKMKKRHARLLELGFKDYSQYLDWKRIMKVVHEQNQT